MQSIRKVALIIAGSICLALGAVGVFVPVLPTTPFVLLAAFLYSRSSSRLNSWLASTSIYRAYVEPFKQSGGISMQRKLRIVSVSFAVMAISALLVRKLIVWIVLGGGRRVLARPDVWEDPYDFQRGGAQLWSSHRRIAGQVCLW